MSTPFRIIRAPRVELVGRKGDETEEKVKGYLERLMKLIPGDAVGVYLVGAGVIGEDTPVWLDVWAGVTLLYIFCLRVFGTADRRNRIPNLFLLWELTILVNAREAHGPSSSGDTSPRGSGCEKLMRGEHENPNYHRRTRIRKRRCSHCGTARQTAGLEALGPRLNPGNRARSPSYA